MVTCSVHGNYKQLPGNQLSTGGCEKCGVLKRANKRRKGIDTFILEARKVHGDRYMYSTCKYTSTHSKVEILCSTHGNFMQTPASHLNGQGCQKCSTLINADKLRTPEVVCIQKFVEVHGETYNYNLVEYINMHTKVRIVCDIHGIFEQAPCQHIKGHGCQRCARLRRAQASTEPHILYYLYFPEQDLYKIGMTLQRIGIANRYKYEMEPYNILWSRLMMTGAEALAYEDLIITLFAADIYKGDRFMRYTGNTEVFVRDILNKNKEEEKWI